MFTVMVAGHDSNEGTSIIRAFSVDLGVSGEPSLDSEESDKRDVTILPSLRYSGSEISSANKS